MWIDDLSIEALRGELVKAITERDQLRRKVAFLQDGLRCAIGNNGEAVVAKLVGGRLTWNGVAYDIISENGVKIEVKYSSLGSYFGFKPSACRRWTWGRILGSGGQKRFDRLILLGDVDMRYVSLYRDPTSPVVTFDVPFAEIASLSADKNCIGLTTNPSAIKPSTPTLALFRKYEITQAELAARYGPANA